VTKRKGSFEGDVAIKELRERMALAPDLPPEPPLRETGGSVFGIVGRLAGLVTMAAVAAYLFVWISTPRPPVGDRFALVAYDDPATASAERTRRGTASAPTPQARSMAASGRRFCNLHRFRRPVSMPSTCCGRAMSRRRSIGREGSRPCHCLEGQQAVISR